VNKPENVNHITAAGAILPAVWAYTALHYQGHVTAGDTVLICDGATANGLITIQLAHLWGAKVLTTASNQDETDFLEKLEPPPGRYAQCSDNIVMCWVCSCCHQYEQGQVTHRNVFD
jgi:hypothetical protein